MYKDRDIRSQALAAITGGKTDWYSTRKQIARAERNAGVQWDGLAKSYAPIAPARPIKSAGGSWGRPMHGTNRAAALTLAECTALGITPGPLNF